RRDVGAVGRAVGGSARTARSGRRGRGQLRAPGSEPGVHPEPGSLGSAARGRRLQRAGVAREQPYVDDRRIAVMGMSNGGRTVLAALRTTLKHPDPFVAGVALHPGCQSDAEETFYAPLLVLIGRADTVTPARHCEDMKRRQPSTAPDLTLVIYPRAPHTFDMPLPDRR